MKSLAVIAPLCALLFLAPVDPARADDPEPNFVQQVLGDIKLGEPVQVGPVTLIPLVSFDTPPDPGVLAQTEGVKFFEPDFPTRRHDVGVMNDNAEPLLVLGGTVLVGGKRDRMMRHTRLVAGAGVTELRAMPAARTSDIRKDAIPFVVSNTLAPTYLRQKGDFGASASTVDIFVTRWLRFRNDGDERQSLQAIAESKTLKEFCLECQGEMGNLPESTDTGHVLGGVVAVRGRVQSIEIFGTNELLRAHFSAMLRAVAYAAAVIEIRADKAGIPFDAGDDPEALKADVAEQADKLLARLRKAKFKTEKLPDGAVGESLLIRASDGTRGRAVGLDGKLAFLAVYPRDPFLSALYARTLKIPEAPLDDPDRMGGTNIAIRGAMPGRRLTPYEQRLLDRWSRRGGVGGIRGVGPGTRAPSGAGSLGGPARGGGGLGSGGGGLGGGGFRR